MKNRIIVGLNLKIHQKQNALGGFYIV